MSAFDPVNEDLGCHLPHFLSGNMYGGQHGSQILGSVDVINADDGNFLGNGIPMFLNGFDGAYGSNVIGTEDGRDIFL